MKFYILFLLLNFISLRSVSQEFRFYINGSNLEDSTFADINDDDLLRIVFINKTTDYKFRISQVSIILTPMQGISNHQNLIGDTTEFVMQNPSDAYTSSPTFMLDLMKELEILKYNNHNVSFKVKQLLSNTEEGSEWIKNNMKFKEVGFRRKTGTSELLGLNAGNNKTSPVKH